MTQGSAPASKDRVQGPARGIPPGLLSALQQGSIADILTVTREHFGMRAAFVTEIEGTVRVLRHLTADATVSLCEHDTLSMEEGYCQHILDGGLPELIPDTAREPLANTIAFTKAMPIGAHIGVPIRLRDQHVYGTFCCFSDVADRSLTDRDLTLFRALADMVARQIDRALDTERDAQARRSRIEAAVRGEQRRVVFQPVVTLDSRETVGFEALSRFTAAPHRSPAAWFADAAGVGLLDELELAAIRSGLAGLPRLPAHATLAVNVSPSTILHADFPAWAAGWPIERMVLEITEHAQVSDYDSLATVLQPLRARGLRLAIDDAGAGYSSLRHILDLRPDIIKLDMSLTRHIDTDAARRSLAAALVYFARDIGCDLIAEGIETESECAVIRSLGVRLGQGYLLGRPEALPDA